MSQSSSKNTMNQINSAPSLKIIAWNAGGLSSTKALEFGVTLKELQIDIALISETHFTKEQRWLFQGYKMYNSRHPSNNARGGASVIVKQNIKHSLINIIEDEKFQTVVIEVESAIGSFNLAAIYSPPRHTITNLDYSNLIDRLGNRFLIGGDWNCKNVRWSSRITNVKGKNLEEAINNIGGNFISPGKPTYFPPLGSNKQPDCIDFFAFNNINIENKVACDVLDVKIDHAPVTLTIFTSPILVNKPPRLVSFRTDWDKFRKLLNEKINNDVRIHSIAALESETDQLVKVIQEAAKSSTPVASNGIRPFRLPFELIELIKIKRKARKKMCYTRAECDKKEFNRLNKIVKKRLNDYKNDKFEEFISSLGAREIDDYSLWKATKYLKRPAQLSLPIRDAQGHWASSSQDKADVIAAHLKKTFQPNTCDNPVILSQLEEETKNMNYLPDLAIETISEDEVFNEIKFKTKAKKAPGFDLISGIVLKNLPKTVIRKITKIFNAVIKLQHIPSQWKKAEIIVLLKPGKPPADPSSYRPISLLPIIGKLFEKIYIKRLNQVVKNKKLIIDEQFGFRSKHGTLEQLHRISSTIESALEGGGFCNAVFLDVAQAFDRVWHQKLIYKLSLMIPGNHVKILSSYIFDRYFRVRFDDSYSTFKPIKAGVPQGSVLSPLLYSLYTSNIPRPRKGCKLGVFADDTVYVATAPKYEQTVDLLQASLGDMQEWTSSDRTKLNASKSENVVFTNKQYVHSPLTLNGTPVPHVMRAKYLGLIMDSKLKWREHILKKREQIRLKNRQMLWLLGRRSKLRLNNKILLYKSMIRPIWAYGCQLWACAAKSNIHQIEVSQNLILRQIANARWYERNSDIRAELGIESIEGYISRMYNNYEDRLHDHPNPEAVRLLDWDDHVRRLKRRKPFELSTPHFLKI